MLKIILDTNVVVSGLIKKASNPELILLLVFNKKAEWCVTREILEEYEAVLNRVRLRKYLTPKQVKKFLSDTKETATFFKPKRKTAMIKDDPADNKFLDCALEAKADFFITGNIKHFSFENFHRTRIITPAEFINIAIDEL